MTITARFPGKCSACGAEITPGTQINWQRGERPTHADCTKTSEVPPQRAQPRPGAAKKSKVAPPASVTAERTWSELQTAIFDHVLDPRKGSAVVCAVAGSGRTTTIVEAAQRLLAARPELRCCFVAFNRSIADELAERLPAGFPAKTLNGFGYSAWLKHLGVSRIKLDGDKTRRIVARQFKGDDAGWKMYAKTVTALVAKAKAVGLVPRGVADATGLVRDTDEVWAELAERYDIAWERGADMAYGIECARKVLETSIDLANLPTREAATGWEATDDLTAPVVDFDDQIYMPVITGVNATQHDFLFVDEAQDINATQRASLRLALKPSGRLIAVGDPYQAIYGFRGADAESIPNIKADFDAVELPLSISYRCPQVVVREAQAVVPHIQASPSAPEGRVEWLAAYDATVFAPEDGVICRNAAPVVSLAYRLLKAGKACRVLGREIGAGLTALIRKLGARNVDELEANLATWASREIAKATAKGNEMLAASIDDKRETLATFIAELPESERTITGLVARIETLFTDGGKGVTTLATIHKSKGLEFPRVFILDEHRMPSPWARQEWQKTQENNLRYVAVTRAQRELVYISLDDYGLIREGRKK